MVIQLSEYIAKIWASDSVVQVSSCFKWLTFWAIEIGSFNHLYFSKMDWCSQFPSCSKIFQRVAWVVQFFHEMNLGLTVNNLSLDRELEGKAFVFFFFFRIALLDFKVNFLEGMYFEDCIWRKYLKTARWLPTFVLAKVWYYLPG